MTVEGKVALVTGASRGIGRAIVLELASRGANVAVNYVALEDRNERDANEVAGECAGLGVRAITVEADVADFAACGRMGRRVADEFGAVDILVNNAGILRDRTFRKMTPEEWSQVISVNLTGMFNVGKAVVPLMIERNYGRIVCLSSVIGLSGGFGQTNYAASKAGIIGFVKSLALEVARKGVTVNAVAPGWIDTEILVDIPEDVVERNLQQTTMGRLGKPEEIAKLVAFLCSDDAAYITGEVVSINGGYYT